MAEITPTAHLYDEHGHTPMSCDTQFRQFGRRTRFEGEIVTVRCHEDNALLKQVVREPGAGKVVVVDAGGSDHCAMLGDKMAEIAATNGWEGLIINGAVRDAALLAHSTSASRRLPPTHARVSSTGAANRTSWSPSAAQSSRRGRAWSATKTASSSSPNPSLPLHGSGFVRDPSASAAVQRMCFL